MDAGLIGGIVGSVVGLAGGAVGTWCSIQNTRGPLERAFMVKAAIAIWAGVTVFLALLLALPKPYGWLMWIPYGILLPWGIHVINKRVAELRQLEGNA